MNRRHKPVTTKLIVAAFLLLYGSGQLRGQSQPQRLPEYLGRKITILEAKLDENGFPPNDSAPSMICLEGPPRRQCYSAPKDFVKEAAVEVVPFSKNTPALLFSAASWGVSGWRIAFALLRPGNHTNLDNFLDDATVSNQSQHAFWSNAAISVSPIFVTADHVAGPDESHYGSHRFIVSAYVQKSTPVLDERYYYLQDRYMTVTKYDLEEGVNVLAAEKREIYARLGRLKPKAIPAK